VTGARIPDGLHRRDGPALRPWRTVRRREEEPGAVAENQSG
jgi:hypothetical protein